MTDPAARIAWRMVEPRGDLDLAQEALGAERLGQFGAQHFERGASVVLEVGREEDRGHPASADFALDAVAAGEGRIAAVDRHYARTARRRRRRSRPPLARSARLLRQGCAIDGGSYLYIMQNVKGRPRKTSRISSKHQITIPVDTLRAAGLKIGERVSATCDGAGRVVLERERDVLTEFVGALTGVYHRDELHTLRAEWE